MKTQQSLGLIAVFQKKSETKIGKRRQEGIDVVETHRPGCGTNKVKLQSNVSLHWILAVEELSQNSLICW